MLVWRSPASNESDGFPSLELTFVEWNLVSALTQAARELFGNSSDAWSMQHPVLHTLICVVLILAVFVPLSVRQYRLAGHR